MRIHQTLPLLVALGVSLPCRATEVVILRSGNRMQVDRAHAMGDSWVLKLQGGGSVTVPASVVKRVSSMAADMPRERAPMIVSRGTGGAVAREAEPPTIPEGIPPEVVRDLPERFAADVDVKAPRLDPAALGVAPGAPATSRTLGSPQRESIMDRARPKSPVTDPRRGSPFKRMGSGVAGPTAMPGQPGRIGPGGDPGRGPGLPSVGR